MIPDLPEGWQSSLAASGAILVVVLVLRWTSKVMGDQSTRSQHIVDRTFDVVDTVIAGRDDDAKEQEGPGDE